MVNLGKGSSSDNVANRYGGVWEGSWVGER